MYHLGMATDPYAQVNSAREVLGLEPLIAAVYDDIDFTIPASVKKAAQTGLDLRKKHGRGGTEVGVATAKALVGNSKVSPEKVRHIAKYFPRHAGDNLDDHTSNGWIAWQLWGGHAGRTWSESLVKRMDARKSR